MEIRNAVPADEAQCNRFHNDHYGLRRTREQWLWEFASPTPTGALPFIVAVEDGEVVGTQAYIPVRFIDEAGIFETAKSEETLVSPKMRGKYLLGKMYDRLFDHARDNGCMSIWGFTPAEKSFRRLGFEIPGVTAQLLLVLAPKSLSELASVHDKAKRGRRDLLIRVAGVALSAWGGLAGASAGRALKGDERMVDLEAATPFDEAYSRRFVETWGGTTILRDRNYMQWRIFDNPYRRAKVVGVMRNGELVGHVAYAIGEDGTGYLVDIMAAHPGGKSHDTRLAGRLLSEAVRRLKRMGAKCIRGWTLNDHPFDVAVRRAALRRGFLLVKRGNAVVFHTSFQPHMRGTSHDDFANWYVTRLFTQGVSG